MAPVVLLVDPLTETRQMLELQLQHRGTHVDSVSDQDEALARLDVLQPHLILVSDSGATDESVEWFLERTRILLQSPGTYTPVVIITAVAETAVHRRWRAHGADDVLVMPIAFEDIQARLDTLLRIRSLHEEIARRNTSLAETTAQLARLVDTDALTNIGNRRYLQHRLDGVVQQAHVTRRPVSVLLADLDHFKQINDTWGHAVGDRVLTAVGRVLSDQSRAGDAVGRWGGEEFLLVLPDTPIEVGIQVATRLVQGVRDLLLLSDDGDHIAVSLSIGAAEMWTHRALRPEALVSVADQALYQAKHTGRNRVMVGATAESPASERRAPQARKRN